MHSSREESGKAAQRHGAKSWKLGRCLPDRGENCTEREKNIQRCGLCNSPGLRGKYT